MDGAKMQGGSGQGADELKLRTEYQDVLMTSAMQRDPWAHHSDRMKCVTCMWFVAKSAGLVPSGGAALGRCRRHAPTLGGYPAVYESDWCGDHKIDENKA